MAVDRCVCLDVTFASLKCLSDRDNLDVEQLRIRTGCGSGCGMCVPYIHVMLKTGETTLPVLSAYEFRQIIGKGVERPTGISILGGNRSAS
jgi:bacterioferritin-associated ferredoxin